MPRPKRPRQHGDPSKAATDGLPISPEQLDDLIKQHGQDLRRFLSRKSGPEGEDLAQEVYVQALSARPRTAIESPVKYLFGIARNVVADSFRKKCREQDRLISLEDLQGQSEGEGLREAANRRLQALRLEVDAALKQLPYRCQIAFIYSRRGWSYAQIADELGVTTHAVKKYVVMALNHLRARLRDNT